MSGKYLEVTFRQGRPLAAYLYLPRQPGDRSCRTSKAEPGLVIDYNEEGRPIGIEITAPDKVTLAAVNGALREVGQPELDEIDLQPLRAA